MGFEGDDVGEDVAPRGREVLGCGCIRSAKRMSVTELASKIEKITYLVDELEQDDLADVVAQILL